MWAKERVKYEGKMRGMHEGQKRAVLEGARKNRQVKMAEGIKKQTKGQEEQEGHRGWTWG